MHNNIKIYFSRYATPCPNMVYASSENIYYQRSNYTEVISSFKLSPGKLHNGIKRLLMTLQYYIMCK